MRWPIGQKGRFRGYHVVKMVHDGDKSSVFVVEAAGGSGQRAAVKLYKRQYDRLARRIEEAHGIPSEGEVGMRLNPPNGLRHEHYPIVRTLHHGREFGRRSGRRYLVQEFVDGVALKRLITCRDARIARFPSAFIVQCCQALRIIHRAGLVYRDLCAQNLMVLPTNRVKLIDLGFVAPVGIAFPERSGTPSYMSPEQIRGEALHPTSDIYSLGILAYELLTGLLPYRSRIAGNDEDSIEERRQEILAKHLEKPVPVVPEVVRGRRPELTEVAERCMQKDAALRFPSVEQIINVLTPKR